MGIVADFIFEGIKEFAGEIIGAVMLAVFLRIFPAFKSLFNCKSNDVNKTESHNQQSQPRHSSNAGSKYRKFVVLGTILTAMIFIVLVPRPFYSVEVQKELGDKYFNARDYSSALYWYRKAAEQGHAMAQYSLGSLYKDNCNNYSEAFKWYLKSAEQGYDLAQYYLGDMYENGFGVSKDIRQADKWHNKALEQGFVPSNIIVIERNDTQP